jgi:septum formation protein
MKGERGSGEAPELVLASGSPRRKEILERLGFDFEVRPVEVDESPLADEKPQGYVLRLARSKAREAARSGELVLAADTVVVDGGDILGKPRDPDDARRMLGRLSGKEHFVHTGVALCDLDRALLLAVVETTRVRFAELSEEEIEWYVASGEPLDKAGAYAVQGLGSFFVEMVHGSYSSVVGLPIATTYRLLRRAGYQLTNLPPPSPHHPLDRP